jgi:hypothetical protein
MKQNIILISTVALSMLFIALLLIFGPLFTIFALNTLFPVLQIPFTLQTWASVMFLIWVLNLRLTMKSN